MFFMSAHHHHHYCSYLYFTLGENIKTPHPAQRSPARPIPSHPIPYMIDYPLHHQQQQQQNPMISTMGQEEEKKKGAEEGEKKPPGEVSKPKEAEKPAHPPHVVVDKSPPPPPEIVLRVYMHCEGCARKVKKSLTGFHGVEDVITDCKSHKVVVKGEKADPLKVLERVQRKISHRHVELVSPIPPKDPRDQAREPEEKEPVKAPAPEKKDEPKAITVVLKVHMHCEACAQEMKKRIERMKEVEVAAPDMKNSEVKVTGTFEPAKLVEYVYKRTGKQAVVVLKQDPPPSSKLEGKEEGNKEEKKKGDENGGDGGGKRVDQRANEYFYYPIALPRYGHGLDTVDAAHHPYHYPYPGPQIFSDENANACSIM